MPDILRILRADQPSSTLRLEDGPFQILWDEERFPYNTFTALVAEIEARGVAEVSDVSLRKTDRSWQTATICDRYLTHKIIRRRFSTVAHNDASIRLMRETVFSASANSALRASDCDRLSECLNRVVEAGGLIGYGRNFFYAVFGYGTAPGDLEIARRFAHITRDIDEMKMRHVFLTAVDYASHTIKAAVAGKELHTEVAALLPSEYQRVFRRPYTETLWHPNDEEAHAHEVTVKEGHKYLLDRDRIIRMTADQFRTIRTGGEYDHFRKALEEISVAGSTDQQQKAPELADALDAYLKKVESVLNPGRFYADRAFEIAGRTRLSDRGFGILCAIGVASALLAPEPIAGMLQRGIELLTVHYGIGVGAEALREKTTRRKEFPTEGFQLGRDVKVSLVKRW
jgi:hypothetical protein